MKRYAEHIRGRNVMRIYLLLIFTIFVGACSNKAVYENIQSNNRNDCAKLPQSQYDECLERTSKPYEEYERERQEVLSQ